MNEVVIYTKDYCGFCARAKTLLRTKGIAFNEIDVTNDVTLEAKMIERSSRNRCRRFSSMAPISAAPTISPRSTNPVG